MAVHCFETVFFQGKSTHHKLHSEASMGGLDFHKGLAGPPFQLKRVWCCAFDDKGSVLFFLCLSPVLKSCPTSQRLGCTTDRKLYKASRAFTPLFFTIVKSISQFQ